MLWKEVFFLSQCTVNGIKEENETFISLAMFSRWTKCCFWIDYLFKASCLGSTPNYNVAEAKAYMEFVLLILALSNTNAEDNLHLIN